MNALASLAMRRVILDTPYAGWSWPLLSYAQQCMMDCLRRQEAPMVSYLLYPPMFGPEGMDAGLSWEQAAEAWVVYVDMGMTHNMRKSIERGYALGRSVEVRCLREQTQPIATRVQLALIGKGLRVDLTCCTHEVDTPRFDTQGPRRLLCWQCACGQVGPSIDEVKAALREQCGRGASSDGRDTNQETYGREKDRTKGTEERTGHAGR